MSAEPPESGLWLKSTGEVFVGLDISAVIRRVVGAIEPVPGRSVLQLQGLTWAQFVGHYADEAAREGLVTGWAAIAEKRVAPAHWPLYLPFKPGVVARLRPVERDPLTLFVAHLSTAGHYDLLNTLIGTHVLSMMDRTIRAGQHLFGGVDGPLTDLQVKSLGSVLSGVEHTQQVLEDLRAAVLLPAAAAPQPQPLNSLFAFSMRDFSHHRITTQQLALDVRLSSEPVYCHTSIRDTVSRILDTLLAGAVALSTITVSDTLGEDTAQVEIHYTSQELALQVPQRTDPLSLSDTGRLEATGGVQRLVTSAHACLKPVGGCAWAEPYHNAARIVLVLPRWKGELPG